MIRTNQLLTITAIASLLVVCFLGGLYLLGVRSEAYKVAIRFIDDNVTVTNNIGPLKSHRLAVLGYSIRYNGPHGYAEYKIVVTGERDKGTVYLNLEKSAGVWKVAKGNLILENGMSIPLS